MDLEKIYELAVSYGIRIVLALLTLIVGLWVIKFLSRWAERSMRKSNFDQTLKSFLLAIIKIGLKVMLVISVISMLGIAMTSFVAVLAATGFAIGMALSGSLQNFAGGVMIVLFKPFKLGDYIEAQGFSGTVSEIHIFNTILKTPDNKTIILPNGSLSNGPMTNYSTEPQRRVDFTFGVGYGDDIDKARKIIMDLITADERILKDPVPFVAISGLGSSAVNFAVRVWVNAENFWGVFFDMNENVKKAFDKNNVSIPFPQTDVHLYQVT
ncbi:MAG: mechanosensitive ion channel [Bacteroidales bacterium]|nr:mechanosensitive ion channel [Bacteroidales bacterium]